MLPRFDLVTVLLFPLHQMIYISFFKFSEIRNDLITNKCRISSVKVVVKHFYSTRDRQKHDDG